MRTENLYIKNFLLVVGFLSLVACGKSNSNNNGNVILNPGVCANCNGVQNPTLLGAFTSVSSRPQSFPISVTQGQIFGSSYGTTTQQYPYNGSYNGYPTTG